MDATTVIISTYNQPQWLEKVLWGFEQQTHTDFELVIADDGSTIATKQLIQQFQDHSILSIIHVWQEDQGFQKTKILNKAIAASQGDYLIFTDGDCIPRADFVATHVQHRKKGYFLSGGYFKLPMTISKAIAREHIQKQLCFDAKWLLAQGLRKTFKLNKLTARGFKARFLNSYTPTKATWDGNNASGWRDAIVAVNGFDERMQYGGEDRELGERLMNRGVKGIQIRYSAITLHLEHARGYVTDQMLQKNKGIRAETKKNRATYTVYGLVKAST